MGVDAVNILATTNISDDDKKDYCQVVKKFNKYFKIEFSIKEAISCF